MEPEGYSAKLCVIGKDGEAVDIKLIDPKEIKGEIKIESHKIYEVQGSAIRVVVILGQAHGNPYFKNVRYLNQTKTFKLDPKVIDFSVGKRRVPEGTPHTPCSWFSKVEDAIEELKRRCQERKKRLEKDLLETNTTLDCLEDNSIQELEKYKVIY